MNRDRFDSYREITARFDSVGSCGHAIKTGDRIGYNRRVKPSKTRCADCWRRWCAENDEAARYEASLPG